MAHRAIIVRYGNETLYPTGVLTLGVYYVCVDPVNTEPNGIATLIDPVELNTSAPATWTATIKAAVLADAISKGCTDLVLGQIYAPSYA